MRNAIKILDGNSEWNIIAIIGMLHMLELNQDKQSR